MDGDIELMQLALTEAALAPLHGDVPIGALVVCEGEVIGRRHNERELTNDPIAHAEVLAMRDAALVQGSWRLSDCTLIVTLEPCIMCAGALLAARLSRVVFAAFDPKGGACGTLYNVCSDPRLNHEVEVTSGVCRGEAAILLRSFFADLRQ